MHKAQTGAGGLSAPETFSIARKKLWKQAVITAIRDLW